MLCSRDVVSDAGPRRFKVMIGEILTEYGMTDTNSICGNIKSS